MINPKIMEKYVAQYKDSYQSTIVTTISPITQNYRNCKDSLSLSSYLKNKKENLIKNSSSLKVSKFDSPKQVNNHLGSSNNNSLFSPQKTSPAALKSSINYKQNNMRDNDI